MTTPTTIIEWQKFFELLTIYGGLAFGIFFVSVSVSVPLCRPLSKLPPFISYHLRFANWCLGVHEDE